MTRKKRTGPKILSSINMKGGVGKTFVSVNLAASLAKAGNKVLLVDGDFQGNASDYLDVKNVGITEERSLVEGLMTKEKKFNQCIIKTRFINLDAISCNYSFFNFINTNARDFDLLSWMKGQTLDSYDFVIIDARPEITKLFYNIIYASDFVFIPIKPDADALTGLTIILRELREIQGTKPNLRLLGMVISMYDKADVTQRKEYLPLLKKYSKVLNIPILETITTTKAASGSANIKVPICHYKPKLKLPVRDLFASLAINVSDMAVFTTGRATAIKTIPMKEAREVYLKSEKRASNYKTNKSDSIEEYDDGF